MFTRKHRVMPQRVGRAKAKAVHFMLPVSFLMVRQVVPHGKWNRQKSIVQRAVAPVQPLAIRRVFNSKRLLKSVRVPVAM